MQEKSTDQENRPTPGGQPPQAGSATEAAKPEKARPALSAAKQAEKERLAEALRANLRRRKAQTRQRQAETPDQSGPHES